MSAKFSRNVSSVIKRQSTIRRNSSNMKNLKPYDEIPGRHNLIMELIRPSLNRSQIFLVTDESLSKNYFFPH